MSQTKLTGGWCGSRSSGAFSPGRSPPERCTPASACSRHSGEHGGPPATYLVIAAWAA